MDTTSPVPQPDPSALVATVGTDLATRILGPEADGWAARDAGAGHLPPRLELRLRWLAEVVDHLSGSYTDEGIRRWFNRPRVSLGGVPPLSLLEDEWSPDQEGPVRLLALAASIRAMRTS